VTLLATGPLSNVARALHDSGRGSFRDRIAAAFIMGGAVHVGGNLCCGVPDTFDNSQEFNMWVDPAAASEVFRGLRPGTISLVPLDATNFVPLTASFNALLEANPRTGAARFVAAMVADPGVADSVDGGFLFWWDPLAAVAATTNDVVRYERNRIAVVLDGTGPGRPRREPEGRSDARRHLRRPAEVRDHLPPALERHAAPRRPLSHRRTSTVTGTTPSPIMSRRRAAARETSMMRPRP